MENVSPYNMVHFILTNDNITEYEQSFISMTHREILGSLPAGRAGDEAIRAPASQPMTVSRVHGLARQLLDPVGRPFPPTGLIRGFTSR